MPERRKTIEIMSDEEHTGSDGQTDNPSVNIKIEDRELRGSYSNLLRITHTSEEFILDFINMAPPQGIVSSRVVTSPGHIKRIIQALQVNLQRYEAAHGPVREAPDPNGQVN